MSSVYAVAIFLFGFVFLIAALFFAVMGLKEHKMEPKSYLGFLRVLLIILFCCFVSFNTFKSGYQRMIDAEIVK
jgi:hypothetical protein